MRAPALARDAVIAAGPASVTAMAWRFKGGLWVTVVAKASFAFAEDGPMARVAPQEIFRAEVHHGNKPARSVRFTSDLAPYMVRADVLFTGHAHAPSQASATLDALPVRLGVFDGARAMLDKALLVRAPGGFTKLPIVYERAYGGIGRTDNPLGVGADGGPEEPNVVYPGALKVPAGYAPIGRAWPARRARADAATRKALEAPIAEIPDAFDWEYFQAAPPDQRTEFLRGEEWIVMDGLHPGAPRARMRLPAARGDARICGLTAFGLRDGMPLALHADTLRIDGDELCCTVTWRGSFQLPTEAALPHVRVVAGVASAGAPIVWPDAETLAARWSAARAELDQDDANPPPWKEWSTSLTDEDAPSDSVLGLAGTVLVDAAHAGAPLPPPRRAVVKPVAAQRSARTVDIGDADEPYSAAMPFHRGASPLAQAPPDTRSRPVRGTNMLSEETADSASPPAVDQAAGPSATVDALPFGGLPVQRASHPGSGEAAPPPTPEVPRPVAPPPAPSAPSVPQARPSQPQASPWAPPPEPPAPPPKAPPPPAPAVIALKKGIYDRFGKK